VQPRQILPSSGTKVSFILLTSADPPPPQRSIRCTRNAREERRGAQAGRESLSPFPGRGSLSGLGWLGERARLSADALSFSRVARRKSAPFWAGPSELPQAPLALFSIKEWPFFRTPVVAGDPFSGETWTLSLCAPWWLRHWPQRLRFLRPFSSLRFVHIVLETARQRRELSFIKGPSLATSHSDFLVRPVTNRVPTFHKNQTLGMESAAISMRQQPAQRCTFIFVATSLH